ncbi:MAG: class I SAM-dependent methyltransferase, partial [Gammaproteobacteria bacterium]|nr:class I SAM-dependent methyltransferase [Gammaproteobacteria bacterium]
MKKIIAFLTLAFVVTACDRPASEAEPAATEPAPAAAAVVEPDVSIYAAAVASETRPEADRARDAGRNPEAVLEFFGIQPGDIVLEMWAGGGYYTELLAHVVGESGKVVAHMNTPILQFSSEEHTMRHADNRLPNTEILFAENNELTLEADSFDAATIVLNYHDLYWLSEEYGWVSIDVPVFLAELYKAIKPGGILG